MRRLASVVALAAVASFIPARVLAQGAPSKPGPYAIDIRGATSGIPSATTFYPDGPASVLIPRRGFGGSIGGHIYLVSIGSARLGLGIDFVRVRGTANTPALPDEDSDNSKDSNGSKAGDVTEVPGTTGFVTDKPLRSALTVDAVVPQISFNFGSRDGWSYLSAGYGSVRTRGSVTGEVATSPGGTTTLERIRQGRSINVGGGARWFLREHVAAGFDVRFHRMAIRGQQTTIVVASVGASLR